MITEFSLFLFTTLGSMAGGAYLMEALFPGGEKSKPAHVLPIVALVLLAIGGIALLLHLGRPERMLLAFSNLDAGIAQEGIATGLFGVAVAIDFIVCLVKKEPIRPVRVVAGILGLALAIIMGRAYALYTTVWAWATPLTYLLFAVGGVVLGSALVAILHKAQFGADAFSLSHAVLAGVFAVVACAEALHFNGLGLGAGVACLSVGALLSAVSCALAIFARKSQPTHIGAIIIACAIVGVVCARYGFYLAI